MKDNIFEKMTEEERTLAWMYMIFNKDKIMAKTEQWTKEAEEAGMTLTDYIKSIDPLKQESCENAISRQAVLDIVNNPLNIRLDAIIKKLPSVSPQPKTGHWIDDNENEIDAQYGRHLYRCSECNKYANKFVGGIEDWWDVEKPNFCPNCGSKMEGMV